MNPKAQLLLLAGLLAAAVILIACTTSAAPEQGAGATATPIPSIAGGLEPTYEVRPTPVLLAPVPAHDAGRSDCRQDWAAYHDPDGYFSVCYPADWVAWSSVPQADFGHTFSLLSPGDETEPIGRVTLVLYWEETNPFAAGLTTDRCSTAAVDDVREVSLVLAGQTISACVGDAVDPRPDAGPPYSRGTEAEIPLGPGNGYVRAWLVEPRDTDIFSDTTSLLLGSLSVGQKAGHEATAARGQGY